MVTWSGALGPDLRGYRKLVTLVFFYTYLRAAARAANFPLSSPRAILILYIPPTTITLSPQQMSRFISEPKTAAVSLCSTRLVFSIGN